MKKVLIFYLSGIILCIVTMYYVLGLKNFDIKIPYVYTGDGLSTGMFIKGMIDNGWINNNKYLGAPFNLEMYDYPLGGDNFQYLIMKLISLFSADYAVVMNLYYLLTYILVFICSIYVFDKFNINRVLSIFGALLYTFLPYHIIRMGHLFLLGYYLVPLVVMVILWIALDKRIVLDYSSKRRFNIIWSKDTIISIVICALVSATGAYYAFFSCFFLLVIGIYKAIGNKKLIFLMRSSILILIIAIGLIINISPSLYYKAIHGENVETSQRSALASETYGLKIVQLILPITNHRISEFATFKDNYNKEATLVNENDTSSLGILGGISFLALLFTFIFYKNKQKNEISKESEVINTLGVMNISAVMLGTIGGFGTIFAMVVSAQIRSYNRLSIFIAFFSILFMLIVLQRIYIRFVKGKMQKNVFYLVLILIAFAGILDQTGSSNLAPFSVVAEEYNSDRDFINSIEEEIPPNSMIFQLPYISFPEGEHPNGMGNYDLAKGYIHSDSLLWSFGGMKGRNEDIWQRELVKQPIEEAVESLSIVGFKGIYIDRKGYSEEQAKEIESKLTLLLEVEPKISADERLVFFKMENYNKETKNNYSNIELEQRRKELFDISKYRTVKKLDGNLDWTFALDLSGYKVVQFSAFEDLPLEQYSISVIKNNEKLEFDDSFSAPNKYSYRHWETPKHFVISIADKDSGWQEENIPTDEDIKKYFNENTYKIHYLINFEMNEEETFKVDE
ncbi:hypothetical protein WAX74_04125 [Psychrobacillus sp. FJAT-51614]|uniref:Glycosyltransferase RgtA/B/C/D-like domain-containing protein n=1 Tax=Psychrobacillus mangrovi TaxID=3117745 RepID=A0ABU8F1F4_9BACI